MINASIHNYLAGSIKRMLFASLILACMFLASDAYGQAYPNGFYFTIPCSKFVKEPMPVFLTDKKDEKVCITDQPVVVLEELESISDLELLPSRNFVSFDFKMTLQTTAKLQKVFNTMVSSDFAFVIDNEVVFVFQVDETKFNQFISISGSLRAGKVQQIHQRLLELFRPEKEKNN